ncbi:PH domain-containing protein [Pseudalkalibacillus sp. Hm43]|uniref:PH domain-containing protein n=1 Tax=Pseudalkalibacillus sp. Hm43 TaxID=3450742 RepID=UPI003F4267D7
MFEPTRLHPLAAGLSFLKMLREWIIPLAIFFLFGPGNETGLPWVTYAPFLFIFFLAVYGFIHWLRFTYHIEGEELKIEHGVFIRKKRYIPKKRIQSIDYTQGILHRIFNVVKVNIETAGGGVGAEASLSAINKSDADRLTALLRDHGTGQNEEEAEVQQTEELPAYTYTLSLKDLIIAASTSGGLSVTLPLVGTFGSQLDALIPEDFYVTAFNWLSGFSWVIIAAMAFFSVFIAWFISFMGVILKYANFQLKRYEDRIVITRGLLEKRELTFPLQRVQGVRVVENVLRQPFGYSTVHVESAGGAGPEVGVSAMLLPIIKRSRLNDELKKILPGYELPSNMHALPKRSLRRYLIRAVLPSVILIPAFWWLPSNLWILLLLPIAVLALFGILRYKDGKWLVEEKTFYMQSRFFSRSLLITEKRRMQDFEVMESFFQRRKRLATMKTAILSAGVGRNFHLKDVDLKESLEAFGWYTRESN